MRAQGLSCAPGLVCRARMASSVRGASACQSLVHPCRVRQSFLSLPALSRQKFSLPYPPLSQHKNSQSRHKIYPELCSNIKFLSHNTKPVHLATLCHDIKPFHHCQLYCDIKTLYRDRKLSAWLILSRPKNILSRQETLGSWPNSITIENTLLRHNPLKSCCDTTIFYRDLKSLYLTKLCHNPDLLSCPSRSRQGNLCHDIVTTEIKTLSRHHGDPCRDRKTREKQLSWDRVRTMSRHREPCHDTEPESSVATVTSRFPVRPDWRI